MNLSKLLKLHNATKLPFPLDGLILLHIRLDNLNAQIWFVIAQTLEFDKLLSTSFIDSSYAVIFQLNETSYRGTLNHSPYLAKRWNARTYSQSKTRKQNQQQTGNILPRTKNMNFSE